MRKLLGLFLLILALAVVVAGCSSSSGGNALPTANPEKQAALNATLEKATLADGLRGSYTLADGAVRAASFLPPPTLNKSAVGGYVTGVDAYAKALADYKSASASYRAFLDANSSECRQALDNESAAESGIAAANSLKGTLNLANDWLAEYDAWKPTNDTATDRINEMLYFASLTDPYHQSSPAEGIRYFNQARPQFSAYLNESGTIIARSDALIAAMDNSTAKTSLVQFRTDVKSLNDWVKTSYNQMVTTFNDRAGKTYGYQQGL